MKHRIAVVSHTAASVGGIETYLQRLLREFKEAGVQFSLWTELNPGGLREPLGLESRLFLGSAQTMGIESALAALNNWKPDVIYHHGLENPRLERQVLKIAPTVLYAHTYYGTCISGNKCHQTPQWQVCERKFGWPCLALYYPRRCGGLNPLTMIREYRRQLTRGENLEACERILVASCHMRQEFVRHGFESKTTLLALPIAKNLGEPTSKPPLPWRFGFIGRMEKIKGADFFLRALDVMEPDPASPVEIHLVGEGRQKPLLLELGRQLLQRGRIQAFHDHGWLEGVALAEVTSRFHAVVVPSLWPEPYGLVGLELATGGIPAVAYKVGGIGDWLEHGENGLLVDANPPTPEGLAEALTQLMTVPGLWSKLSEGAAQKGRSATWRQHLQALQAIFEEVATGTIRPARD